MSRLEKSIKNIIYAVIGQFFGIAISFITRTFFIRHLGAEFLGIDGLFTNVLSVLSLAELGVGTAIIFSLYKPLAKNDVEAVKSLMALFKKAYTIIGGTVLLLGTILTIFLALIFPEISDVPNIRVFFALFVANSGISYFYAYKRSLIIADQKRYIATQYRYVTFFLVSAFQIALLAATSSYIMFLTAQLISTFIENILISIKANKLYPFLLDKNIEKLSKEEKDTISKNVRAIVMHKIGNVVVNGTKSILLSRMISVIAVGIYSNYFLITNALNAVISLFLQSVTASIGNLGASEEEDKKIQVFYSLNLIVYWIFGLSSICLFFMFNHFIEIWIGREFLFDNYIVAVIVINFYLTGMRRSILTYRDALGLYWHERHKPILESLVNIAASILLGMRFGTLGIFIGTTVSNLTVCLWIEPYILFKHGLRKTIFPYYKRYTMYLLTFFGAGAVVGLLVSYLNPEGIAGLILIAFICLTAPNIIFLLAFHRNSEFIYLLSILKRLYLRIKQREGR